MPPVAAHGSADASAGASESGSSVVTGMILSDEDVLSMFRAIDTDNDSHITMTELKAAAQDGKLGPMHAEAAALMEAVDTDKNDMIELPEFVRYVRSREALLSELFQQIDSAGEQDGHITADELQIYLEGVLKRPVRPDEAQHLLKLLDTDNSGTVELAELLHGTVLTVGGANDVFRIWGQDPDHFYLAKAADADVKAEVATPPYVTALAGIMSGGITAVCMSPLDVLKTQLQLQKSGAAKTTGGIIGSLKTIAAKDGVRGLYKGLTPSLMALLPNWAVYFTAYDMLKTHLRKQSDKKRGTAAVSPLVHMAAAAGAGVATTFVTNPLWVVKTRIQTQDLPSMSHHWVQRKRYNSAIGALYRIATEEGLAGLYSGLIPSLVGVCHVAIQFPLYEAVKSRVAEAREKRVDQLSALDLIFASGFSKLVASTATYPHEVVRSQMHVAGTASLSGCLKAIRTVHLEDGIHGFYRGCATNLCRTTPAAALTFTSFELVSRALKKLLLPVPSDAAKQQ